jgi:Ca2+-binding EF-hand superfamily protein
MYQSRCSLGPPLLVLLFAWLVGSATACPGRAADAPARRSRGIVDPVWLNPRHFWGLLQQSVAGMKTPEFVEYIQWNLTGEGQGWFHPGESRYGWKWLADRYDANKDGKITRKEFTGPAEFFDRLDRNQDGVLTAADFDWSLSQDMEMKRKMAGPPGRDGQLKDREAMLKRMQEMVAGQFFHKIDTNSNGRISQEEWLAVFTKAAKGKDHLTLDDLRQAMAMSPPRGVSGQQVPDLGTIATIRLTGMFKAETGSIFEGPRVGQLAPDFTLKTQDGKRSITLSQYRNKKPVVLVFGNYT